MGFVTLLSFLVFVVCSTQQVCENFIRGKQSWNARPPKTPLESFRKLPVPYVIIHHTDTPYCNTTSACAEQVRTIQDVHQNISRTFADVGYNFLVAGDGWTYEGRSWDKIGAHSPYYNEKSLGIALIGNFTSDLPPNQMLRMVQSLINCGVQNGAIHSDYKLLTHKQVWQTHCPGEKLYLEIKKWPHWTLRP